VVAVPSHLILPISHFKVGQGHLNRYKQQRQRLRIALRGKKRNSAIPDKPRDTFIYQSRSLNIVPFHMLGMVSY